MLASYISDSGIQWILGAVKAGLLGIDGHGIVVAASESAQAMLGSPGQTIAGRPLASLLPWANLEEVQALIDGRAHELPDPAVPRSPFARPAFCRLIARRVEAGLELLVLDESERYGRESEMAQLKATMAVSQELLRHKNQELDESLERMGKLNEKLSALDGLKSQFLSNTSHELRTPLNTIIGSLQLVREGLCESRDEEREYFDTALAAAQRLLKVINEMLDSAKLSAGKMKFLIEDHKVGDLFDEIYSHLNPPARQKGIKLTMSLPEDQELHVRADLEKTKQVLLNLVGNAIKFTEEGEISLSAETIPDEPDQIRFRIRDSGIGMDPEKQQGIFDQFTQIDGSATRRYEGAGLGLAVTRNLVEMMGGTIELRSEGAGKGSEAIFTLPMGDMRRECANTDEEALAEIEARLPQTF
jgi:signal transduction histidine kinase